MSEQRKAGEERPTVLIFKHEDEVDGEPIGPASVRAGLTQAKVETVPFVPPCACEVREGSPGERCGRCGGEIAEPWVTLTQPGQGEGPPTRPRAGGDVIAMPEADRRTAAAPLPAPNAAQHKAIEETVAIYEANPEVGLLKWRVIDPEEFLREGQRPGGIYIEFLYRDHLSSPDRPPGREVTVFAPDGSVLDSQDFG